MQLVINMGEESGIGKWLGTSFSSPLYHFLID